MGNNKYPQIITSILDNDLYAFTMGWAFLSLFPKIKTDDELLRAGKIVFPEGFAEELQAQVNLMENMSLQGDQAAFMRRKCSKYLPDQYIEWLRGYRFDPHEVKIEQKGGHLSVYIHGYVHRTVYWETPLLALISELYYKMTGKEVDVNYVARAEEKGRRLRNVGARFSEFGTRRRFSKEVQKNVLEALILTAGLSSEGGVLNGTSNVQLAMDFDIDPMGTNAHKYYQTFSGLFGVRSANRMASEAWQKVFDTRLGIALTDTLGTADFLENFSREQALLYDGLRHDSGDPFEYTDKVIAFYKKLGIDPMSKTILFSDSLNVDLVEKIVQYCKGKIKCAFGIGTFLSNDIKDVEALGIVIKQIAVYLETGRKIWTVKISDNPAKASGDPKALIHAKYDLGIEDEDFDLNNRSGGVCLDFDGKQVYIVDCKNIRPFNIADYLTPELLEQLQKLNITPPRN